MTKLTHLNYNALSPALREAIQQAKDNYCINDFIYKRACILAKAIEEKLKQHDAVFAN